MPGIMPHVHNVVVKLTADLQRKEYCSQKQARKPKLGKLNNLLKASQLVKGEPGLEFRCFCF